MNLKDQYDLLRKGKTRPYTRGMWYTKPEWSTDTRSTYYKGFN